MKERIVSIMLFWLAFLSVQAQTDRQFIREGNRLFRQKQYAQAEVSYRKALGRNPQSGLASYNLGCALQAQGKDGQAIARFTNAARQASNSSGKAKAFYNLGRIQQKKQDYQKAIEAYKNALRANPHHDNARFNLAMCMRQQQQQQKQNKSGGGKNDKNQNKNKDNQEKKQNNKDKNKQEKQNPKNQPRQKEQMSKDNAEQLLNAAMQKEKATQERLKKAMQQPSRRTLDENW